MALFLLKKFFKQRKVMSIVHYVFVWFLICGYFIAEGNEKQQITDIPTQASGVTSPIFRVVSGDGELKAGVYVRSISRPDFQLAIPGEVLQTDLGPYIVPLELNNNQILPQLVIVDSKLYIVNRNSSHEKLSTFIEIGGYDNPVINPMTGDTQFIPPLGKNLPQPKGQIQFLPSPASNITVFQKKINFPDINGVQIILISVAADGLDRKLTDLTFAFLVRQNVETRSLELFSKPYLLNYEFIEDPETLGQLFDEKNLNEKKVGINSNYVKRLFAKQLMNHSGGSIERKTNKVYDRSLENYFNS